jgi:putative Mg2+ transporter-C (MgtC) family protein
VPSQILLHLVAAALLTSILGLERQLRGKPAGLRTHALVGLGSALVMVVSQTGFNPVLSPGRIVLDPSRVAAQVVSGIGFLGAGLIIVRRDYVRGLTTAAGIWVCAAIGLACGAGLIPAAVATTGLSLVLIYVYAWMERAWLQKAGEETTIRVVGAEQPDLLDVVTRILAEKARDVKLIGLKRVENRPGYVAYDFRAPAGLSLKDIASSLLRVQGVADVREEPIPLEPGR